MEGNVEVNKEDDKNKDQKDEEKPAFGIRPNTKNPEFDFKTELERLPFELNIGNTPLTKEQQA